MLCQRLLSALQPRPARPSILSELLEDAEPDRALICGADVGVLRLAREIRASCAAAVSTQTSILNHEAANFWADLGAERIVLARELSLDEIAEMREKTPKNAGNRSVCPWRDDVYPIRAAACFRNTRQGGTPTARGVRAAVLVNYTALMEEKTAGQYLPVRGGRARHLSVVTQGYVHDRAYSRS